MENGQRPEYTVLRETWREYGLPGRPTDEQAKALLLCGGMWSEQMKTTDGEIMQTTDEIQAAKTPYQHAKEALEMIRQDRDRWYRKSAEVMDECLALHKQIDDLTPKRAGDIYLSAVEFEELRHHMETGPVHDDHCVSKAGRDSLLEQRLLARIVMRGDDGCCAVTMLGQDVYRMLMCEVNHE